MQLQSWKEIPVNGKCLKKCIVYNTDVEKKKKTNGTKIYYDTSEGGFRTRYTKSIRHIYRRYANNTELSKHVYSLKNINPILIRVYPCKRGWPDLPHFNSNLSNSHSLSRSIQGILLFQTNTFSLLLYLRLPRLIWSSSLPLVLHFKTPMLFLKTCPSSLLNTCLYHLTPFAFAI